MLVMPPLVQVQPPRVWIRNVNEQRLTLPLVVRYLLSRLLPPVPLLLLRKTTVVQKRLLLPPVRLLLPRLRRRVQPRRRPNPLLTRRVPLFPQPLPVRLLLVKSPPVRDPRAVRPQLRPPRMPVRPKPQLLGQLVLKTPLLLFVLLLADMGLNQPF